MRAALRAMSFCDGEAVDFCAAGRTAFCTTKQDPVPDRRSSSDKPSVTWLFAMGKRSTFARQGGLPFALQNRTPFQNVDLPEIISPIHGLLRWGSDRLLRARADSLLQYKTGPRYGTAIFLRYDLQHKVCGDGKAAVGCHHGQEPIRTPSQSSPPHT